MSTLTSASESDPNPERAARVGAFAAPRAVVLGAAVAMALVAAAGIAVGAVFLARYLKDRGARSSDAARHVCARDGDCPADERCFAGRCAPSDAACASPETACGGRRFCFHEGGADACNCKDSEGRRTSGLQPGSARCKPAPPPDEKVDTPQNAYRAAGGVVDARNAAAVARYLGWDEANGRWSVRQLTTAKASGWTPADPLPVHESDPTAPLAGARFCVDRLPEKEGDVIAVARCRPDETQCRAGRCAVAPPIPPAPSPPDRHLSGAEIAGITVGSVAAALLVAWIAWRAPQRSERLKGAREQLKVKEDIFLVNSKEGGQLQPTKNIEQLNKVATARAEMIAALAQYERCNSWLRFLFSPW